MNDAENELRKVAQEKLREAEKAYHDYAKSLPISEERFKAWEIYENIRNAGRVYK